MYDRNIDRAPLIARTFAQAWREHAMAIQDNPLIYLDCLIDEMKRTDPEMSCAMLKIRLYKMVPNLKLGTAGRLIDCKFQLDEFGPSC